jgi:hypothetical protein
MLTESQNKGRLLISGLLNQNDASKAMKGSIGGCREMQPTAIWRDGNMSGALRIRFWRFFKFDWV